jgi:hypothetical protein
MAVKRKYDFALLVAGIISLLGALAFVVGGLSILLGIVGALENRGTAFVYGASLLGWGVLAIAGAQMMQAVVATAVNTAEMCEFLQSMAGRRAEEKS